MMMMATVTKMVVVRVTVIVMGIMMGKGMRSNRGGRDPTLQRTWPPFAWPSCKPPGWWYAIFILPSFV